MASMSPTYSYIYSVYGPTRHRLTLLHAASLCAECMLPPPESRELKRPSQPSGLGPLFYFFPRARRGQPVSGGLPSHPQAWPYTTAITKAFSPLSRLDIGVASSLQASGPQGGR